ncbi:hypothetical protein FQA39_LY16408 [Lamprigera yunnana]|nr:hypothetical protein FQA39_LY16408 [Lamprigera yunnana]
MKFYVFVSVLIVGCMARPQFFAPPNTYLPSASGLDDGGSHIVSVTPQVILNTDYPAISSIASNFVGIESQTTPKSSTIDFSNDIIGTTVAPQIFEKDPTSSPYLERTPSDSNIGISGGFVQVINNGSPGSVSYETTPASTAPPSFIAAGTHKPVHAEQPRITESRFTSISKTPTGSYLPITNVGSHPIIGDGNYLEVPVLGGIGSGVSSYPSKSVYFYAAPEEQTQTRLRINILPSSEASTRVIFIKAPTYPVPIPEVISAPSKASEKTVIYVLSKKPDPVLPISIPSNTVVKSTKPEIFFIKYGSQKEAKDAIASGVDGRVVGQSIKDLLSEQSFLDAIKEAGYSVSSAGGVKGDGKDKGSNYGPAGESGPYI